MYTRHTSINIPKNYSGNRFKQSEEIPVKEHRPIYTDAIKTAHSPIYSEELSKAEDVIQVEDTIPTPVYEDAEPITEEELSSDIQPCEECDSEPKDLFSHLSLPIKEILKSIDKEELLLIGLILLISAEKDNDNNTILTLLSLLLLHK